MINSEVASLDASTTTNTDNNNENEQSKGKKMNKNNKKNKSWIETVVLKSQRSFQEEEFTSFDRSQTPDYFINKSKSDCNNDNENHMVKFDLISIKNDQLNDEQDGSINKKLTTSNF